MERCARFSNVCSVDDNAKYLKADCRVQFITFTDAQLVDQTVAMSMSSATSGSGSIEMAPSVALSAPIFFKYKPCRPPALVSRNACDMGI